MFMYIVYILHSPYINRFYIGQTQNFENRLFRHNNGLVKSTKHGKPWELVHKFSVNSRSEALLLEKKIKGRGAIRYLKDNNIASGM